MSLVQKGSKGRQRWNTLHHQENKARDAEIHTPAHPPTASYRPPLADCKGAEATFQPKWYILSVVKPSERNKATYGRISFPIHPSSTYGGGTSKAVATPRTVWPGWWFLAAGKQHWDTQARDPITCHPTTGLVPRDHGNLDIKKDTQLLGEYGAFSTEEE